MERSKPPQKTLGSKIMLWLGRSAHMNTNDVTWVTVRDLVLSCDLVLSFVTWCCRVTCYCRDVDYEIYEV